MAVNGYGLLVNQVGLVVSDCLLEQFVSKPLKFYPDSLGVLELFAKLWIGRPCPSVLLSTCSDGS